MSQHKEELKRFSSDESGQNEVAGPEMKQLEQKRKIMQKALTSFDAIELFYQSGLDEGDNSSEVEKFLKEYLKRDD